MICSHSLRKSASSFLALSLAAFASASFTIRSISSSLKPEPPLIVIVWTLPVPRSLALTWTIPLASISNFTSICGTPLGASGIPLNWKRPRVLLSAAIERSPCNTWISTAGWLSAAVENTCDLDVGIVVLRGIRTVETPPNVSIPNERGVTSNSKTSLTSPARTPPWMAAPIATTSSGLMLRLGSFPNSFLTNSCTHGIRVEPPTNNTWLISDVVIPASFNAWRTDLVVESTKSRINSSNLDLVRVISKCTGLPSESIAINGILISVVVIPLKSFFAFSASSFNLNIALLFVLKSIPFVRLNSLTI